MDFDSHGYAVTPPVGGGSISEPKVTATRRRPGATPVAAGTGPSTRQRLGVAH